MKFFQELIWDLGELTKLPLHIDDHGACTLLIEELFPIQLDMDQAEENVVIIALLGEVPPGRFREELLKGALKANGSYQPWGTLSYSQKKDALILHAFLDATECRVQTLVDFLVPFIAHAESWQQALQSGTLPQNFASSEPSPPPFGLR